MRRKIIIPQKSIADNDDMKKSHNQFEEKKHLLKHSLWISIIFHKTLYVHDIRHDYLQNHLSEFYSIAYKIKMYIFQVKLFYFC